MIQLEQNMITVLLMLFAGTLLFFSMAGRLVSYLQLLSIQGLIIFFAALLKLSDLHTANLIFILIETVIVKAAAIPLFLGYVIRRNNISRDAEPSLSSFVSLVIVLSSIVIIFFISYSADSRVFENIFFVVSLSTVFTGVFLIITRRKIITHIIGYLVIENGVFILSIAVGNEMPMLINIGVLLDVLASVLVLGIFINKIGDVFKEGDIDQLTGLKD